MRQNGENHLKALILAGGFGTRLKPLSCTRPKSLFPILNRPLLQWTFERLAKNGIDEAILAVNYQTEVAIKQHQVPKHGVHITYSRDPLRKPLGTGGPVKKAEKLIGHDASFLVLNGDIFADVNYREILKMHKERGAIATIALHEVEDPSRYGVAELVEDNRIRKFIEKPRKGTAPTNLINAGVYALSPKIFEYMPKDRAVSMEREIFPRLAEQGALYGYFYEGLWVGIGKPEDYLKINREMLVSFPNLGENRLIRNAEIRKPVAIDKRISVGKGSALGPYAVIGKDVFIGKNVQINNSIIFAGSIILDFSSIHGAIVGEGVTVGERANIQKGCIIGDHARIGGYVNLAEGTRVCPASEVSKSGMPSIIANF